MDYNKIGRITGLALYGPYLKGKQLKHCGTSIVNLSTNTVTEYWVVTETPEIKIKDIWKPQYFIRRSSYAQANIDKEVKFQKGSGFPTNQTSTS